MPGQGFSHSPCAAAVPLKIRRHSTAWNLIWPEPERSRHQLHGSGTPIDVNTESLPRLRDSARFTAAFPIAQRLTGRLQTRKCSQPHMQEACVESRR